MSTKPGEVHGDILVSQQLFNYDLQRVGENKIISRGDKPHASPRLLNHLKGASLYWETPRPKVRFGAMLTGDKLVDNFDYREQLKQFAPEAIGGEMEGAGLYVACHEINIDWILVKAICDWGDGKKSRDKIEHQEQAAYNAANFVLHSLKYAPIKHHGLAHEQIFSTKAFPLKEFTNTPVTSGKKITNKISKRLKVDIFEAPCDPPPALDVWIGRTDEIDTVQTYGSGIVVAATGIGGQGKSAFAVKLLNIWRGKNPSQFWDWRDCREQSDTFHTKVLQVLERLSEGRFSPFSLSGATFPQVLRYFFQELGDRPVFLVFDNVDHYVDVENRLLTHSPDAFARECLRASHRAIILFTCRPRLIYPSNRFEEIQLKGLSYPETKLLFEAHKVIFHEANLPKLRTLHEHTDGHPFWLTLMATQLARKPASLDKMVLDVQRGQMDERAEAMFETIWNALNKRQQIILHTMAELTAPEDAEFIFNCSDLDVKNYNRFDKAFSALLALNLVVEREAQNGIVVYDLHPIVRKFSLSRYASNNEHIGLIDTILKFLDELTKKNASRLSSDAPATLLNVWIEKAEIQIKSGRFDIAVNTLAEVAPVAAAKGVIETVIRLSRIIFLTIPFDGEEFAESKSTGELFITFIHFLVEFDQRYDAFTYLRKLQENTPKGSARFVYLCDLMCYCYWYTRDFDEAVKWGRLGQDALSGGKLDTKYDVQYNLALALRDSGAFEKALKVFLKGASFDDVFGDLEERFSAADLGNIGRCLQFDNQHFKAIVLYKKAANIFIDDKSSHGIQNLGYACLWIGEVLEKQDDLKNSWLFYRWAEFIWLERAPFRSDEPNNNAARVFVKLENASSLPKNREEIERVCKKFLTG